MSSNPPKAWVQITVAVLGAVGLIVPAILNNWHNLGFNNLPEESSSEVQEKYTSEVKSMIQLSMMLGKRAYWDLDSSLLEEVFIEGAFKLLQSNIAQHKSTGHRINISSSNMQYINITFTKQLSRAKVRFTRSLSVSSYSLQNGFCIESTPEYQQELTYDLKRQMNGWKIFAIDIHTSTPKERLLCS